MFLFHHWSVIQKVSCSSNSRRLLKAFHTRFKHHPLPPLAPATLCLSFPMLSRLFLLSISICVAFANLDVPLVGPQGSKSAFNSRKTEELRHTVTFHPVRSDVCVVFLYI